MFMMQIKAYGILVKHRIKSLPVDASALARAENCVVASYSEGSEIIRVLNLAGYCKRNSGISIVRGDKKYILYKDSLSFTERNRVIAHELGHIILHHSKHGGIFGKSEKKFNQNEQETEANEFGRYLLAPLPVLHKARLTKIQMEQTLGLSGYETAAVAGDLHNFWQYLNSPHDKQLRQNFKKYIRNSRLHNIKSLFLPFLKYLFPVVILTLILLFLLF